MNCCRYNCAYISVIAGIIVGVILGVLYTLGFVSTGILFWAYLAIGVAGVLLAPIYASSISAKGCDKCFCRLRGLYLTAAIGTIVAAAVGLIVSVFAGPVVIAIVVGVATFFTVMQLVSSVCLTECLCNS